MKVTVVPVVIGVLGTITKGLVQGGLRNNNTSGDHPNSNLVEIGHSTEKSVKQSAFAGVKNSQKMRIIIILIIIIIRRTRTRKRVEKKRKRMRCRKKRKKIEESFWTMMAIWMIKQQNTQKQKQKKEKTSKKYQDSQARWTRTIERVYGLNREASDTLKYNNLFGK